MSIEVQNLSYTHKDQKILSHISLSFPTGSVSSILGPSGCGKSTFLNIVSGLIPPTQGEVFFQDHHQRDLPIGYVTQKDLLLPFKTVFENLWLICRLQKDSYKEGKERVGDLLSRFHLQDFRNKYPRELSGGLRQRINLLRQILVRSPILLLDEPFVALDIITKQEIEKELFQIVKKEGRTVLLVTHDIHEALALSDQIILFGDSPTTVVKVFPSISETSSLAAPILDILSQTYR